MHLHQAPRACARVRLSSRPHPARGLRAVVACQAETPAEVDLAPSPILYENPFASLTGRFAPPLYKADAEEPTKVDDFDDSGDAARRSPEDSSSHVQMTQWYPGHIAKAERQLKAQLTMVDVVLEVRDARIPVATCHPQVAKWVGTKPRLLVMNRLDMVSSADKQAWEEHFKEEKQRVFWTDGKAGGPGIKQVRAALLVVSSKLNHKRALRGLKPRPVRACVIGFPNIGKSALINRLLDRRVVDSAPKPGVTRALRWVRLSGELDLLDAPGVIPASFDDQIAAQRLAICNDIGEASYVDSLVAELFIQRCRRLGGGALQRLGERYQCDPSEGTAEDFVRRLADKTFFGDLERGAARILKDFRTGFLGSFALELPEDILLKRGRDAEALERRRADLDGDSSGADAPVFTGAILSGATMAAVG